MDVPNRFTLASPELEAQVYYFTPQEGGRHSPVFSGYRGQFHYNGRDWDAPQQFVDKDSCYPGESVIVYLQTVSPYYHKGKFYVGKKFEIREGAKGVGTGTVTKILRPDFEYWQVEDFLKQQANLMQPYPYRELQKFKANCKLHLMQTRLFDSITFLQSDVLTGMVTIRCYAKPSAISAREVGDKVLEIWNRNIGLAYQKTRVDLSSEQLPIAPYSKFTGVTQS